MNKYIHAIGYGSLLSLIVFIGLNNIKTTKAADYYQLEAQKAKADHEDSEQRVKNCIDMIQSQNKEIAMLREANSQMINHGCDKNVIKAIKATPLPKLEAKNG